MIQSTSTFYQDRVAYIRTRRLGWLMGGAFLLCTLISFFLGLHVWGTYTHVFTLYLKWQDALVALLWFVTFLTLRGSVLVLRFQYAVRVGYIKGVFSLIDTTSVAVRDISAENLASIFWILNASFWCFVTVLVGLTPLILIGWTLHLTSLFFAIIATSFAVLLSLAGLVLSIAFSSFIVVGCFGEFSFWQKMGAVQVYALNTHTIVRCDDSTLTVIYPDMPESMLDLNTLDRNDKLLLLALLRERWLASDHLWTLSFNDEACEVVQEVEVTSDAVLVS